MILKNDAERREIYEKFELYQTHKQTNPSLGQRLLKNHDIEISEVEAKIDCMAHAACRLGLPRNANPFEILVTESNRVEHSISELSYRLSPMSMLAIYQGEVGERQLAFTNAAFQTRFLVDSAPDEPATDRFRYLDTTAEHDRSEKLWESMMAGLTKGTSWTTEVPVTKSGATRYYNVIAFAQREADEN